MNMIYFYDMLFYIIMNFVGFVFAVKCIKHCLILWEGHENWYEKSPAIGTVPPAELTIMFYLLYLRIRHL